MPILLHCFFFPSLFVLFWTDRQSYTTGHSEHRYTVSDTYTPPTLGSCFTVRSLIFVLLHLHFLGISFFLLCHSLLFFSFSDGLTVPCVTTHSVQSDTFSLLLSSLLRGEEHWTLNRLNSVRKVKQRVSRHRIGVDDARPDDDERRERIRLKLLSDDKNTHIERLWSKSRSALCFDYRHSYHVNQYWELVGTGGIKNLLSPLLMPACFSSYNVTMNGY